MRKRIVTFIKKKTLPVVVAASILAGTVNSGAFLDSVSLLFAAEANEAADEAAGSGEAAESTEAYDGSTTMVVKGANEDLSVSLEGTTDDLGNVAEVAVTTITEERKNSYQEALNGKYHNVEYEVLGVYDISLWDEAGQFLETMEPLFVSLEGNDILSGLQEDGELTVFYNTNSPELWSEPEESPEETPPEDSMQQAGEPAETEEAVEVEESAEIEESTETDEPAETADSIETEQPAESEDAAEAEETVETENSKAEGSSASSENNAEVEVSAGMDEDAETKEFADTEDTAEPVKAEETMETAADASEAENAGTSEKTEAASAEEDVSSNALTDQEASGTQSVQESLAEETDITQTVESSETATVVEETEKNAKVLNLENLPPVNADDLVQLDSAVRDEEAVVFTADGISEYVLAREVRKAPDGVALDLESSSTQKEIKLHDETYFEMDKYLSEPTGEINNQNTYNVYLEQALVDLEHPEILDNPAPAGQNVLLILDQSSSMASDERINGLNTAISSFFQRLKEINDERIENARNGLYTDVDPNGDVESQMANNLIRVSGIIGYNNHIYNRYRNVDGLPVNSDTAVETLTNASRLQNDLDSYLAGNDNTDMQEMTRTDLALQQAETWINEEGTPEQSYVVLMTDGCPTLKESGRGWCRDLVSDDGFVLNMSSKNANDSLRTARRIKDAGSVIDTVYIQWDQGELAAKAYETGKIEDINCEMWGHMPVFLSLVSSDYPKNGTFGTDGTFFNGTYTYEEDSRNKFGQHVYLSTTIDDLQDYMISLSSKIDSTGVSLERTGYASSSSYIQDTISMPFEKQAGIDIRVYKVPRIPENLGPDGIPTDMDDNNEVGAFRWGRFSYTEDGEIKSEWIDISDEVTVFVSGSTIRVSGFDYEDNAVVSYDKDTAREIVPDDAAVYKPGDYGYKLVVIVPINAKITFGGNQIATNNQFTSQFYPSVPTGTDEGDSDYLPPWAENTELNPEGNEYIEKYPLPVVDLKITYDIVADNLVVYAPQTAEVRNLVTDANNLLWYTDLSYYDLKTLTENAEREYKTAEDQFNAYEEEYGRIENPSAEETKKLMDLEVAKMDKLTAYQEAQASLASALSYIPDGINNQFVDIHYELRDPDGVVIATMDVPHGKAYVAGEDGSGNIDWNITGGENAIVTKSGTYKITATVSPVDTTIAPGGLVYTALDDESVQENIGYSSEAYSSTGSSSQGSQSPLVVEKEPTAHLFQLKITTSDSRLMKNQALDFAVGGETLQDSSNPHLVSYEWVCTDGQTASTKENEPGITGLQSVGSGVTMVSQIPEAAEAEGLVVDISGTLAVGAEDGGYVPVSVILSRNIGNLNKSVPASEQVKQTSSYMTDNDNIWGEGLSSVIWEHECDIMTEWDCNDNEFDQAQRYNTTENASGRGQVQYLIHVLDNPLPEVTKSTSTPNITKGTDIQWNVSVTNDELETNPNRRSTDFTLVDILPYVGDERIDPNTNREGSQFGGELMYKTVTADFSHAANVLAEFQNGEGAFYYTTEEAVRAASESQIMGTAGSGNITWTKADGEVDGTSVAFQVPMDAVAIRLDALLLWEGSLSLDMTANVKNLSEQEAGDYYHNEAIVLNGNGMRISNVVATTVTTLFLSGTVWEDADSNGLISAEEKRLEDIVVTLYVPYNSKNPNPVDRVVGGVQLTRAFDSNGDKFAPYVTLNDGNFSFDDIPSGTYYIVADYIPDQYDMTTQRAGKGDPTFEPLDSEAEPSFTDMASDTANTAWIKAVTVSNQGVPNQNFGVKLIKGSLKIGKTLDEIYYPSAMTEEEKEDYRVSFLFKLKNTDTGEVYTQPVYLDEETMHTYQGRAQVYAQFTDLPLGTYELTEVSDAQYTLDNISSVGSSPAVAFDKGSKTATFRVTAAERDFEVMAENKLDRNPPGGDENGVTNHIGMRIPVSLELKYVGADPISSDTLTKYTFQESDFSPAKGGDIIVTYDDGTTISLSEGTLRFDQITLNPATVTNDMNSGNDKIAVTGYYAEKGRTVTDSFRVTVDLKPVHKFQLNFDANGARFDDGSTTNSVRFGYNDNLGVNYVINGTYKDASNGGMTSLSGFTFAGWNTRYDGTGVQYDSLAALNAIGKDTGVSSLTLYANWKTNVTFNAQGGTMYNGTTTAEKALNGKGSGSITVSRNQAFSSTLMARKTNYNFVLWNTRPDGTGTNLQDYGRITGPVTFYAIYYQSYYAYTGGQQVFRAPVSGWYKFDLTGASGGGENQSYTGGSHIGWGGHASGMIWLRANTVLYVYVGGRGVVSSGGYNGGGSNPGYAGTYSGGGGATDLRLNGDGNWRNNLSSRIIVAGGGGGSDDAQTNSDGSNNGCGGDGGGISGTWGLQDGSANFAPGTQTSGYAKGQGGPGTADDGGGGGGGFYGGYGSNHINGGGGGGSGYVSGMAGCAAATGGYYCKNASMQTGTWYGHGYAEVLLYRQTDDPNSNH